MPITLPNYKEDERMEKSRIEVLSIRGDMLLDLIAVMGRPNSLTRLAPGTFPDDAKCVGFTHDPTSDSFRIFIHSATFEPLDPSMSPPEIVATFTSIQLPNLDAINQRTGIIELELDNKFGIDPAITAARTEPSIDAIRKARQQLGEDLIDTFIRCNVIT